MSDSEQVPTPRGTTVQSSNHLSSLQHGGAGHKGDSRPRRDHQQRSKRRSKSARSPDEDSANTGLNSDSIDGSESDPSIEGNRDKTTEWELSRDDEFEGNARRFTHEPKSKRTMPTTNSQKSPSETSEQQTGNYRDKKLQNLELLPDELPQRRSASKPIDKKSKKDPLGHVEVSFEPERGRRGNIAKSKERRKGKVSHLKHRGSNQESHKSTDLELFPDTRPPRQTKPKPSSRKEPDVLAGDSAPERDESQDQGPSLSLLQEVTPGAVPGVDWLTNDDDVDWVSFGLTDQDVGPGQPRDPSTRTLNVVATLVDDDEPVPQQQPHLPLAHATKSGPWKDRRVRIVLLIVLAVVIILSVVLGLTLSSIGSQAQTLTDPPATTPSALAPDMPSSAPTSLSWAPIGEVGGADGVTSFGETVQLSTNGQRLLVSSLGNAHTYDNSDLSSSWNASGIIQNILLSSMSADGSRIAAVSADGYSVVMYDYDSATGTWTAAGPELNAPFGSQSQAQFRSLKLSPDGRRVAVSITYGTEDELVGVHEFADLWVSLGDEINNDITVALEGADFYPFQETILAFSSNGSRLFIVDHGDEDLTTGFLRVYDYDPFFDRWDLVGTPQSGSQSFYGVFGKSIATSSAGDVVVLSSQDFFQPGAIYCFRLNSTMDWSFEGNLAAGETDFDVQFVSMSSDGNRIALQNSFANIRLFQTNEKQEWESVANDIITATAFSTADSTPGQQRLAMSSDGKVVAIGLPDNDVGDRVQIHELLSST